MNKTETSPEKINVTFYMKSGNNFTIRCETFQQTETGYHFTGLEKYSKQPSFIIPDQVEAIVWEVMGGNR